MNPKKSYQETTGEAMEVKGPRNQIEALEKELASAMYQIQELKTECLSLYRRLYGEDRPRF